MTNNEDDNPPFVCHACIGDRYLKSEIRRGGTVQTCMICSKRKRAIDVGDLCDRVHQVITEEFDRTASEPESWTPYKEANVDWERNGEPIDQVLYEVLECDEPLIEVLKEELSNQHHSFDDAASGEEDPYGDEAHYEPSEPNDIEFRDAWSTFETEIRTRARFFSSKPESILDDIFSDLNRFRTHTKSLFQKAGPNTKTEVLYRARRASDLKEIGHIVEHPARELCAPPSRSTGSGRMNPRWISMFYGAFDPDTCIAEIRPPVGSYAVVGKFTIVRKLRLLRLDALQHLFVKEASYFDPEFRHLRDKARFLRRLVAIMSRPVMPTDEDYQYLPTQAVAEYLSEKLKPRLDGLIFPSSQRDGHGENVVLFRRASTVEPDGNDELDMETNFGSSPPDDPYFEVIVWSRKKSASRTTVEERPIWGEEAQTHFFENRTLWSDLAEDSVEKPALRVDQDAIEVRTIKAVEYNTETGRVHRYTTGTDEFPF